MAKKRLTLPNLPNVLQVRAQRTGAVSSPSTPVLVFLTEGDTLGDAATWPADSELVENDGGTLVEPVPRQMFLGEVWETYDENAVVVTPEAMVRLRWAAATDVTPGPTYIYSNVRIVAYQTPVRSADPSYTGTPTVGGELPVTRGTYTGVQPHVETFFERDADADDDADDEFEVLDGTFYIGLDVVPGRLRLKEVATNGDQVLTYIGPWSAAIIILAPVANDTLPNVNYVEGSTGVPFSVATGFDNTFAATYSLAPDSDPLPDGITLSADGVWSPFEPGDPTTADIIIRATNSITGAFDDHAPFTVTIAAPAVLEILVLGALGELELEASDEVEPVTLAFSGMTGEAADFSDTFAGLDISAAAAGPIILEDVVIYGDGTPIPGETATSRPPFVAYNPLFGVPTFSPNWQRDAGLIGNTGTSHVYQPLDRGKTVTLKYDITQTIGGVKTVTSTSNGIAVPADEWVVNNTVEDTFTITASPTNTIAIDNTEEGFVTLTGA